ncbi:glycoside hydrolase superfamily, partial [Lactarius psammicola]
MKLALPSILTFVRARARRVTCSALSIPQQGAHQVPCSTLSIRQQAVIAQMFQWTWDSVAAECTTFLGPAGYASPAQEHVEGPQWWTDYQPVSHLTSKRGTRAQYANMISTCHAAGVGVIADTIWNHMAGEDSGIGVAGSNFTHYNILASTKTKIFTIAASSQTTISLTMTMKPKCGPASSKASQ